MRFLLGGYSADQGGAASGIGLLVAGAADDHLAGGPLGHAGDVVAAESPSWVTAHPGLDVVYAALEGRGVVQAYRQVDDARFVPLGDPVPAGEAVCHVEVSPDRRTLFASCWGDGRVVRMALDAEGRPHTPVVAEAAVDPYGPGAATASAADVDLVAATRALREAAGAEFAHLVPEHDTDPAPEAPAGRPSRSHQTRSVADGVMATTDMGLDLVRFWRGTSAAHQVVLPRGSGPRHMVRHPSGYVYVVTELSREVFVLRPAADGSWSLVGGTSLGPTLDGDAAAEIALSRDAEYVYAGIRGSDTIATLRVRGEGDVLQPVALVDAGVRWPRHHLVVRDTLLVAGQRSDDVASLALDDRTGVPGRVRHRTTAPSPTCILPMT